MLWVERISCPLPQPPRWRTIGRSRQIAPNRAKSRRMDKAAAPYSQSSAIFAPEQQHTPMLQSVKPFNHKQFSLRSMIARTKAGDRPTPIDSRIPSVIPRFPNPS
ncbi:hypothetical protein HNI00_13765 [Thermoleptolyngbya oregonensis NK1-22]|uniref:Uncharacterized protein n=1 Tax=Thermoleptolyngbya oregonensis NK1-22 TaxID=2547457 RepID=A0AA96Y506_9CYAN|nr:hypothetical protein [Thermoleptolyngbya oregonensis]WOB44100.1 hypothetical protein HNI00_13765 [Thermoleptolyngbya oregonensis NK1-22]